MRNGKRLLRRDLACSLALVLQLAGCATVARYPPPTPEDGIAECRALYRQTDDAIAKAGVRDQGPAMVAGFPYLRTTRLIASFRDELSDAQRWPAWIGHMAALDAQARALELRNLHIQVAALQHDALRDALDRCRERLLAVDLARPEQQAALRSAATVADDYVGWWRAAGLYPLTAALVSANISALHATIHGTYAQPLDTLPVAGELVRWAVPSGAMLDVAQVRDILQRTRDPLGIPQPAGDDLDRLFDSFAPIWEVDVADDDDRIGMLRLDNGPLVDVSRPTLYRTVSYARFGGQVLLQLNYIIWFPARSGSDLYGGRLDGINWRVTLGPDGVPWLYDAIHNCGCYHEFFPGQQLRLRSDLPAGYFEAPLVPQLAPVRLPLVLRIAHHTHYIQRLFHDAVQRPAQPLGWEDYDALRSLPDAGGYRSLFGEYGLIAGTERRERFLLWPMGIRSPGAMRQWGRHATAFVGRRHFDDPFLIESLFERTP